MDEAELDDFLEKCSMELLLKQETATEKYSLGNSDLDYLYDPDAQELRFTGKNGIIKYIFKTSCIGSYSYETGTWQWTWANKNNPALLREVSRKACDALYVLTWSDIFHEEVPFELELPNAQSLISAVVQEMRAFFMYLIPSKDETIVTAFAIVSDNLLQ